ncbi:MAG: hypothetical protein LBD10_07840 [Desulfobulbus sp.]|jgi:hypothetical protein|uniref:hypothetical protein n=1 Tax=Desulfobulbus sp. TaxID=895 RepID=UPI00284ADB2A|nr:hypothetical protein [Desulfobulbus sp.]MDR2550091.1 hypothetical protein [Desulfobulbus sp.]
MNNSIACVFPETLPAERFLLPLVQVFGQVVHMQAIENAPPEQRTATAFTERCRRQGRLGAFTPVPLGEQRERFLALAQDIRRCGDTYISQLSMATLAGLGRRGNPEQPHAILADLLRGADIREQEQAELMLWQSRLMLELGEAYDIQQAELNEALRTIARRQDSLFAELCEEEEHPFALPTAGQDDGPETDTILRHRLKAWTRLCFHGRRSAPGLLVSRHRTAIDLLQEIYEKRWRQSARLLAEIAIPVPDADREAAGADEPSGRRCPDLDRLLAEIAAHGSGLKCSTEHEQLLRAGLEQWARVTAEPAAASVVLELYLFPRAPAARLFSESFADGDSGRPDGDEEDVGCVAGLLKTV